jgi:hypothetical protein
MLGMISRNDADNSKRQALAKASQIFLAFAGNTQQGSKTRFFHRFSGERGKISASLRLLEKLRKIKDEF